jgi:hypothetical protein
MNENTKDLNQTQQKEDKPNETSGFYFSSAFKIFDPNTKEVLVQQRGDD